MAGRAGPRGLVNVLRDAAQSLTMKAGRSPPARAERIGRAVILSLADNLRRVEDRIAAACGRAGRARSEVTLVAVTKSVDVDVAAQFPGLGVTDLGESRPQELWRKAAAIAGVRWHLIGHLQRNKIDRTLPLVHRLHSVDSLRLLDALEAHGRPVEVYLEFNCSGEASKGGFRPEEASALVEPLGRVRQVRVVGLMTMAALEEAPERCRPTFARLREVRDELRRQTTHPLAELSMGMSNDYEVAIEEGATCIRLGTVLFEGT